MRYTDPSGHNLNCGQRGSHAAPEDCADVYRTAEQKLLEMIVFPIHDPDQNNPHGFLQKRGDNYMAGKEPSNAPYFHPGVDSGDKEGTPVYAAAPGIVVFADWTYDYGYTIIIEHIIDGEKFYSLYGHLGTGADPITGEVDTGILVTVGTRVTTETQIGTMGNTKAGGVIPAHLHFEIRTAANINLQGHRERGEYIFLGTQWWAFEYGDPTWYRIFPDWRDGWVDLGRLYGYDPSAPLLMSWFMAWPANPFAGP